MKNRTCRLTWTMIVLALTAGQSRAQSIYEPYTFTTFVGSVGYGTWDGTGRAARFNLPGGVAVDSTGNIYVADTANHAIRKVTPAGTVRTLAGKAGFLIRVDTTGFNRPEGVAVDSTGDIYVADTLNHTIRKLTPTGSVTMVAGLAESIGSADGAGDGARFNHPHGLAVDGAGNLYVADTVNHLVRKVTPAGVVTTLAGMAGSTGSADGTGNAAQFNQPSGVAVDSMGNLYVADTFNHTIRKVTPEGVVTTLAGLSDSIDSADGNGSAVRFHYPSSVTVDKVGNLYVADTGNQTIRKVILAGDVTFVTTFAGLAGSVGITDGTGGSARFWNPYGVTVDSGGNVYVADLGSNTLRKITPAGVVTTLAGLAIEDTSCAAFQRPSGVAVDGAGIIYVLDVCNRIRSVTPTGMARTLAGQPRLGNADGTGTAAQFNSPRSIVLDSAGNFYVADMFNST
ncbi:MAG: hypothetical protein L0Z50_29110, partial [Verrucomicrobiales bacterium]|nr:hypothetical protein [Verrucomicrobiales bacterium]